MFRNSTSCFLYGEKPTTILPPNHNFYVQSVHKAEELLSDRSVIDVFVRERGERVRERGGEGGRDGLCQINAQCGALR